MHKYNDTSITTWHVRAEPRVKVKNECNNNDDKI